MLDVDDFLVERGGSPDKIRESQRRRGESIEVVDQVIALFGEARSAQYEVTQIGSRINSIQKETALKKKAKQHDDAAALLEQKRSWEEKKKAQEAIASEKQIALRAIVKSVGNYVADSVPVSDDEDNNEIIRTWPPQTPDKSKSNNLLPHDEVLLRLDGYDPERGVKLVGHRGYCLTGYGMLLNNALANFGIEFLFERGYTPIQPPYLLNRDQMAKTAQLSQFDEELYRVTEGPGSDNNENVKYLIATSEQPLSCMYSNEWLQPNQLPIKFCGYSTCFRKEAGSHGRDTRGIFRIHQFDKVEQLLLCDPKDSWRHFDEMIATSEEFYRLLGLPYRIVNIVSGALNSAASKKYDLEAWFPSQQAYRELVSCSNCTDYQTRELEIRFGYKKGKTNPAETSRKEYVHALNATLCATQRTLCCVLENFQTPDGFTVPEVLRKYIPGQPQFIPFARATTSSELPVRTTGKGQ